MEGAIEKSERAKRGKIFWNPFVGGLALGLVLLMSFLILGKGLGASGATNRIGVAVLYNVAPDHLAENSYMSRGVEPDRHPLYPLKTRLMFLVLGVLLGGIVAAFTAKRGGWEIVKGPRIGNKARLGLALGGGVLMGIAARLGLGCTSGQALSGGALLSVGSWVFMMAFFGGAYALAWFMRRQWS